MIDDLQFFITNMPDSRPADYYLGCFDGSVFIDFDNCKNDSVRLKRITFDGYGCCDLGDKALAMSESDSKTFRQILETQSLNNSQLSTIVKNTIKNNSDLIWKDALNEYGLV